MDGGLRPLFRKRFPHIFWQSVETGATGRGCPDSFGIDQGKSFWVEFKQTKGWKVNISPEQIGWHLRFARYGGKSFIAVRQYPNKKRPENFYLFSGRCADRCTNLLGSPFLLNCSGSPAKWDWYSILDLLTG